MNKCNHDCFSCKYDDCICNDNKIDDLFDDEEFDFNLQSKNYQYQVLYRNTDKGKSAVYKYNHSDKCKSVMHKYNVSEKGKERSKRYEQTEKRKAYRREWQRLKRLKDKEIKLC